MAKKNRQRLDQVILERGLADTRSRAKAMIMAGSVSVQGKRVTKAGTMVDPAADIQVAAPAIPFVSRGGLKLEKALDGFNIDVTGRSCLDVGASTGGFTHCLLERGARRVIALDVGYGQLDWTLRNDPRVTVMERTNIRHVTAKDLPFTPDLAVIDVSFISLRLVVPAVKGLLAPGGEMVALIKPQFEAGPKHVGKGGIVRDPEVHEKVISELKNFFSFDQMLKIKGVMDSPIKGAKGNREFLCHLALNQIAD